MSTHSSTTTSVNNTPNTADPNTAGTTSNSMLRGAQETMNKAGESLESGFNSVKRAVVGGSETGDKVSETMHQGQNRAGETGNRIGDKVNQVTSNLTHGGTTTVQKDTTTTKTA